MKHQRIMIAVVVFFLALGCAKDRTLDEWKSEQQQKELAKLKSEVEGVYPGELQSRTDGKPVGNIVFELEATYDSAQNASASQQVIINGQVTLTTDVVTGRIAFAKAYYDSESGLFKATTQVTQLDGEKADIALSGRIQNHVFTGDIEVLGFKENSGHFSLQKSGDQLGNVSSGSGAGSSGKTTSPAKVVPLKFSGIATHSNGEKHPTQLILTYPQFTKEQNFTEALSRIRTFRALILLSEMTKKEFPSVKWDLEAKTLHAEVASEFSTTIVLHCTSSEKGWACRLESTGLILTVDLQPVNPEARTSP